MVKNRSTNQPSNGSPQSRKVRSWQVSDECDRVIEAAIRATKKTPSYLIDKCLQEFLPEFVQTYVSRRADPLGVRTAKRAA